MSVATDLFEKSFRAGTSTVHMQCNCGKIYFDSENVRHALIEEQEIRRLNKQVEQGKATSVDYSIGILEFEGRSYADACTCWHPRAERIAKFLDGHATKIADYFKAKREMLMAQANAIPAIEQPAAHQEGGAK